MKTVMLISAEAPPRKMRYSRLILRNMTENDYDALYQVLADSDIMQHYPYTFDEARVRGWISCNIERYRIFGFGLWAVCLKETGEMIGDCGLTMQVIHISGRNYGYHSKSECLAENNGTRWIC